MSYNSYLPAELMYLFRELPSDILNQLELYPHSLKNNNLKQISQDIATQLEDLLEQLSVDNPNKAHLSVIRRIYHIILALSDQWRKLYEKVEQPTTVFEAILRTRSYSKLSNNDINFFDPSKVNTEKATHKMLMTILNEYASGTGGKEKLDGWREKIEDIIEDDPKFINNHFIEFSYLLRFLSVPFGMLGGTQSIYESMLYRSETANFQGMIALHLTSLATILTSASQHTKALEYYDRALLIAETLEWQVKRALLNNKGIVLIDLGRYEEAEKIYRKLVEDGGQRVHFNNLASVLKNQGKYEEAIFFAKKNIKKPEESFFALSYDTLHDLYLEIDDIDKAKELEPLADQVRELRPIPPNKIIYKKMVGQRHYHQGNLSLAKEHFEQALDIALQFNNLRGIFNLYTHLIDVQTDLYALRPEDEQVRNQLYSLINSILQLSDEQGLPVASIEILQLRAEAFIQDEMLEEAREDLFNAAKLAKEFEFDQLEEKTNDRLQEVIAMISENKPVEKDQTSLIGRFKSAVKRLVSISPSQSYEDKQTEIHGVMIITDHGTNVFDKYMSDRLQSEPALISGLISAVSSFITEIASGKGFLKSIMHDDMSLIMEPVASCIVVCIAEEETFAVREKTRKFANQNTERLENAAKQIQNGEIPHSLEDELEENVATIYN